MAKLFKDKSKVEKFFTTDGRHEIAQRVDCKYPSEKAEHIKTIPHGKTNVDGEEVWDMGQGVVYNPIKNRVTVNGKTYTGGASLLHQIQEVI